MGEVEKRSSGGRESWWSREEPPTVLANSLMESTDTRERVFN